MLVGKSDVVLICKTWKKFARNAESQRIWLYFLQERRRKTDALRGVGLATKLIGRSGITKIIGIIETATIKVVIKFVSRMPERYLNI